jgi:hypothetical protein
LLTRLPLTYPTSLRLWAPFLSRFAGEDVK